jgi:hypothetical protein
MAQCCWWGDLIMVQYRCQVMLAMALSSHACDGAAEVTLVMARCCCWGDVGHGTILLPRQLSHRAISRPSHAGEGVAESYWWWRYWGDVSRGATEATCLGRNVAAESYWRWRGKVMLAMVLLRWCWSWHDVVTEATWPWCNVVVESCWRWCCRVMLVTALPSHAGDVGRSTMLLPRQLGRDGMSLLTHAGDSTTTQGCTAYGKVAHPPSSEYRAVVVVWRSWMCMSIVTDIHVGI